MIPLEVELIIFRYLHELNINDIRQEISRNAKASTIYKLKWEGISNSDYDDDEKNSIYDEEYDKIMTDKNISSLYFRNKIENILFNYY